MSGPPPKFRELLKRAYGVDQEPELVKESEWSYVYKVGDKSYSYVSKFLEDENFRVEASTIRARWPGMSEEERLDFVQNFWSKASWDENDTQILEIIMEDGNDHLWEHCAQAFLRHPDRDRAVRFLIERMEKYEGDEPANYIQALSISKDPRSASAIRPYFEKYQKEMEAEKISGIPDDVVFGPMPYSAYLNVCGALLQITGSAEYEQAIRKYLDHQSEQVRWWAENALGIEGPTTAKRRARLWKGEEKSET